MTEGVFGNDEDRVHVHLGAGCGNTTVQGRGTTGQIRGEQRAGYETELLARAKLALMGRLDRRTIRLDGGELWQVADIRLQVGMDEHHITWRNRRSAEVRT